MDFDSWQEKAAEAAPTPKLAPHNRRLKLSSTILIIAGLMVALAPLYTVAYGTLSQWLLRQQWSSQLAQSSEAQATEAKKGIKSSIEDNVLGEAPIAQTVSNVKRGRFPATKIAIPRIGVNQVVLEGSGPEVLKNGPGHYRGMALPGERGNVGIAGHRVTWTKPFNRLDELKSGDLIILDTFEKRFEYRVAVSKVLDPKDTSMLRPTTDPRVTLTTCNPKFSARTRLDVQAVLVRTVDKTPKVFKVIKNFRDGIVASVGGKPKPKPKKRIRYVPKSDLKIAEEEVTASPRDPRKRMRLGVVFLAEHRAERAAGEFRLAAKLSPADPLAHYYLGLAQQDLGRTGDSRVSFEKAVSLHRSLEPALFELGKIALASGKYKQASVYLKRAVALAPLEADNHYNLGLALEKMGEWTQAAPHYRTVLKYVPEDARAKAALKRMQMEP